MSHSHSFVEQKPRGLLGAQRAESNPSGRPRETGVEGEEQAYRAASGGNSQARGSPGRAPGGDNQTQGPLLAARIQTHERTGGRKRVPVSQEDGQLASYSTTSSRYKL